MKESSIGGIFYFAIIINLEFPVTRLKKEATGTPRSMSLFVLYHKCNLVLQP